MGEVISCLNSIIVRLKLSGWVADAAGDAGLNSIIVRLKFIP